MAPETGEDTRRRRGEERRGRGLCRAGKKGRLDGGWPVSVVGEVRRERNIAVKERLVSAVSDSGSDECSTRQKDKSGDAFVCYTRKRGEETENSLQHVGVFQLYVPSRDHVLPFIFPRISGIRYFT